MKPVCFGLFIVLFTCSCGGYRTTAFTSDTIHSGAKKEDVINRFGKPFKTKYPYVDNKKIIEAIYYKEVVDVSSYTYILNTVLTFEDSILVKIEQHEEPTPDTYIRMQSP